MTTGFCQSLLLAVWQLQWQTLLAEIAVVVNGGGSGIELMALMAALSMVAAVDGGGNDGVFTTPSYNDDHHPCPHGPCPCPPLGKDRTAVWSARCNTSHLSLPWSSLLAPSLSPLARQWHQG
jgi:hypothetical protein